MRGGVQAQQCSLTITNAANQKVKQPILLATKPNKDIKI